MTGRMDGKVAVITGGGNGIGRACALRLAEEGAAIVVADLQEEPAAETVSLVTDAGGRATPIAVDVTAGADNEAMAELAVSTYGRIDAVVTAAGISHAGYVSGDLEAEVKRMTRQLDYLERPGWDFVEQDPDEWDTVMAVNVKGTLLSMQACVARMLEAGHGGTVVTIASIAAKHPDAGPLAYTTSKAGVWMLTKKAARMLGPVGIRVNAIGPGFIDTHMTKVIDMIPDEQRRVDFYAQIPLGRKGVPLEIANTALFLCSDESSYFSGEILHPDGGFFTE
ncbi:MAG: SDR family oxidoreductase [Actinomycetota bacterium]